MKTLGLMGLYNFPAAKDMLDALAVLCDYVCVRFQVANEPQSDYSLLEYAQNHIKVVKIVISKEKWNRWNWREDLIGLSDSLRPDLILFPDEDERFGDGIEDELKLFMQMPEKKVMWFDYEMYPPNIPVFPEDHHAKAFKWQYKLAYQPYPFWGRMATYHKIPNCGYNAKTKIIHYSQAYGNKEQHR